MQMHPRPVSSTHFNYIITIIEGVNNSLLHVFRKLSTYLPVFKRYNQPDGFANNINNNTK